MSRRKSLKCSRHSSVSAIVGIQFQGKDLDFSQNGNQICVKLPRDYKNEPAYVLSMTT